MTQKLSIYHKEFCEPNLFYFILNISNNSRIWTHSGCVQSVKFSFLFTIIEKFEAKSHFLRTVHKKKRSIFKGEGHKEVWEIMGS